MAFLSEDYPCRVQSGPEERQHCNGVEAGELELGFLPLNAMGLNCDEGETLYVLRK